MKKLLNWFDNNILTVFSFFLLVFIPLYPKLPLFEAIPGYIVRVRLEDLFILLAFLIFLIQVKRKKAVFKSVIFWPLIIYLAIGLLSSLSAIFISKTIPLNRWHLAKLFLHWLRRIEYFSIFFIFYNGLKKVKQVKAILSLSFLVVLGIAIYGYGQKYFFWPVYSTMNREFSKGVKLYLTEHARVPSTFGGHYDLAAFLVIFLPLLTSYFLSAKKRNVWKWVSLIVFLFAYWLLILTASRTSFVAYLAGMTILFFIFAFRKGIKWAGSRWLGIIFFSLFIMIFFGDLSDRFASFLHIADIKKKYKLSRLLSPLKPEPINHIALTGDLSLVMDRTDERPIAKKPSKKPKPSLPPGVYKDIPNGYELESTTSATFSGTASFSARLKPRHRDFSKNAYKYGLSIAIRLDTLWPRALAGLKKNPLLGSGYSTLTKSSVTQFTEAESTDDDYLRILGETGILGFISFFSIIVILIKASIQTLKKKQDSFTFAFLSAFIAATIGLLVNALYIDVFEASKVAFSFWAMAGILLAVINEKQVNEKI